MDRRHCLFCTEPAGEDGLCGSIACQLAYECNIGGHRERDETSCCAICGDLATHGSLCIVCAQDADEAWQDAKRDAEEAD